MTRFIAAIVFVALMATAVFAVQSSPQPSTPPQPQTGTMGQAPQQPANPPSSPLPQGRPNTEAPPPQAQPPAQPAPPSIDEQAKMLAAQLNLNDQQQGKLKNILQDQHDQAMAVVRDTSLSRDQKLDKIHSLRVSTISRVRETLSNDEQRQKFDAMVKAQDQRIREREEQQRQQNPGSPR